MSHPIFSRAVLRPAVPALLALGSAAAQAHAGLDAGQHHGFFSGLLHPMSGLDHLAAMLAGVETGMGLRRRRAQREQGWNRRTQDGAGEDRMGHMKPPLLGVKQWAGAR
jgi:chloramphenicol 3-O-phosphotransferase